MCMRRRACLAVGQSSSAHQHRLCKQLCSISTQQPLLTLLSDLETWMLQTALGHGQSSALPLSPPAQLHSQGRGRSLVSVGLGWTHCLTQTLSLSGLKQPALYRGSQWQAVLSQLGQSALCQGGLYHFKWNAHLRLVLQNPAPWE